MCVVRTSFQKIYNTKREGRNREKKQVVRRVYFILFSTKKNNQKHKKKQEKEKGEKENSVTQIRAPSCFYLNNRIPSKKLLPGALPPPTTTTSYSYLHLDKRVKRAVLPPVITYIQTRS
jgi:hypothetical protein